jgi:isopentenyl-diphosphate Delta-isomerase
MKFVSILRNYLDLEDILETESRKSDHIELAFKSQEALLDTRFSYEPMLGSLNSNGLKEIGFLGKKFSNPLWVSSMTGGTEKAGVINKRLAKICKEFGIGMGLGSCRIILNDSQYFDDFNLRPILGDDVPFFANLGVAQVEELIIEKNTHKIQELVDRLDCDGIIVHVNPLQEWTQPEGDTYNMTPVEMIEVLLEKLKCPIIVKEVGQGFGKESMKALLQLPIAAIDFAAHGGTNFAKLELLRDSTMRGQEYQPIQFVGHSASEMVNIANEVITELGDKRKCNFAIISGGVKNFLDGYYLTEKLNMPSVYGQASVILKHALESEEKLNSYYKHQIEGLRVAKQFLKIK